MLYEVFRFDRMYSWEYFLAGLRRPAHRRGALIIAADERPVSHILTTYDHVSIYGCRIKVASIGGVSTHPDHRGKGYAGAILRHSLDRMTRAGAKLLIVSGNRTLYRRNHCARVGHLYEADLRPDLLPAPASSLSVRRVTRDDWPLLAPVHQTEPVRFLRTADSVSRGCFWWDCDNPEFWLIESKAGPLAYLGFTPVHDEEDGPTARRIFEYAGSRAAILDALPAIFQAAGLTRLRFRILGHDQELIYLLSRLNLQLTPATFYGTHRLLDLPGLMRQLRPYLAARLPRADLRRLSFQQEGETCTFAYGNEHLQLDLTKAVALVLGAPDAPKLSGDLHRLLSTIYPLPFPTPGFNYV